MSQADRGSICTRRKTKLKLATHNTSATHLKDYVAFISLKTKQVHFIVSKKPKNHTNNVCNAKAGKTL